MVRGKVSQPPVCDGCRQPKPLKPTGLCFSCDRQRIATIDEVAGLIVRVWYRLVIVPRNKRKAPLNLMGIRNALETFLEEIKDNE